MSTGIAPSIVLALPFYDIVCALRAVTKQRDPDTGQHSLFFQVDYPEIVEGVRPRHRFMSAYEQKLEPPDRQWQYLLFAAEPYETISFKVCYAHVRTRTL